MPNGELVPVVIDYHDDRGWTDQQTENSDRERRTWAVEAGQTYYRVQIVNGIIKTFAPQLEDTTVEIQSNTGRDMLGSFPAIFYYRSVDPDVQNIRAVGIPRLV